MREVLKGEEEEEKKDWMWRQYSKQQIFSINDVKWAQIIGNK